MSNIKKPSTKDLISKYSSVLRKELNEEKEFEEDVDYSKEYRKFRNESLGSLNTYEKACQNIGKSFKIRQKPKKEEELREDLETAHLEIKPEEAAGLAVFILLIALFLSILIVAASYLLTNQLTSETLLLFLMLIMVSFFLYYYFNSMPKRVAQKWHLKAASQTVPAILYIVVYMRHTSNLERAIQFASQYVEAPLSLDLKKIFWDVETGKFSTIRDSLDAYLQKWKKQSPEFVESVHMIESSLYEPSEEKRLQTLDKSLEIILDGIYEKMLHYSHDIKSPITNIYMLGIVLPTLGLALLPLASTLLQGAIKWYHIFVLFNLLIPFFVYYMVSQVLIKRPGGFGDTHLLERNPRYYIYKDKSHYFKAFLIVLPLLIIGLLPFIFQIPGFAESFGLQSDYNLPQLGITFLGNQTLFDFKVDADTNQTVGPFGLFAILLSLLIPYAIGLFFHLSYKFKTQQLMETRKNTKKLEAEFGNSLFQLSHRLEDGIPVEMAFGRVAQSLKGSATAGFFAMTNANIQQAGMSVNEAIFNRARGSINFYPSDLIKTSMRILAQAVKKGLKVGARALESISEYIKNIHKVNERLKDLLADITSGMKSNMVFLAPLLSAIVVGLAAMMSMIINKLQTMLFAGAISGEQSLGGVGVSMGTVLEMFQITKMIPPYILQVIVGVYIIEIIFILTAALVTIEEGKDELGEKDAIGKNLSRGIGLYVITSLIAILALSILAITAIGGIG